MGWAGGGVTRPLPTNLREAVSYFDDLDVATKFIARMRWPNGPICPNCAGREHYYLTTRRLWKCKACKRQFSVKAGTIFEASPIPLSKWLPAVWAVANRRSPTTRELAAEVGVTQVSAWRMLNRIREATHSGTYERRTA